MRIVASPAFSNKSTNPYNSLLYGSIRPLVDDIVEYRTGRFLLGRIDIVHVHWPDLVVSHRNPIRAAARSAAFLARMTEYKARGARIVWTIHNLVPHDARHGLLEAGFWPVFLRLLDGLVFLSAPSRDEALATHPTIRHLPYAVIPHGHYKPVVGTPMDRASARDRLGLPGDKFIFLYFGQVRDYKNVPLLMREFLALDRPETCLVIAGRTSGRPALRAEIEQLGSGRDNIRLDLTFIPDETLHAYLAACDFVVLPYKRVLNSGSVLLALSAGRPVIGPKASGIAEIADRVGTAWMRTYSGALDKRHLLEAMKHPSPSHCQPELGFYDWDVIAKQTVEFYRRIISGEAR